LVIVIPSTAEAVAAMSIAEFPLVSLIVAVRGVTRVGEVANVRAPLPVSSVTAEARFALDGVPRNVATPAARPLTPVLIGKPVALVRVPLDGVPRAGVTSVGEVAKTSAPLPVSSLIAVAKEADVDDARFDTEGCEQFALPLAATPVAKLLAPHCVGAEARAVAVVAEIVPLPLVVSEAPVPTTIAAVVFVLEVIALNVDGPVGPVGPVAPRSPVRVKVRIMTSLLAKGLAALEPVFVTVKFR
jgi:hypothetical protein